MKAAALLDVGLLALVVRVAIESAIAVSAQLVIDKGSCSPGQVVR